MEKTFNDENRFITLSEKVREVDKSINDIKPHLDLHPITDGIININHYLKAKYKILWVLKEPYYDFIDENGKMHGGGWDLKEEYNKKGALSDFNRKTFDRMIFTTYGLLNNFCSWGETISNLHKPEMIEAFKSSAYINVKKIPGGNLSNATDIENAYRDNREILLKQIEYYDPDVVIFGRTLNLFVIDLGINRSEMKTSGRFKYFIKDNKVFIDAYHPAYWCYSKEKYYNDILGCLRPDTAIPRL